MSDTEKSARPVMRLFEARARAGCAEALAQKLATTSVDVVQNKPGNEGHFFARSIDGEWHVFLFASVWTDLDAVKARFGADWQSSYLPAGYGELIEACSVRHFELGSGWPAHD